MHIKAFLKKISQMPNNSSLPISTKRQTRERYSARKGAQVPHFSNKIIVSGLKDGQSTLKFLDNHHPLIKARLLKTRQNSVTPQLATKVNFRQKVEQRLMDLMNHRQELILTRANSRKAGSTSVSYNSLKHKKSQKSIAVMPQYVQNIMKPCKITSINLETRPKSGRVQHSKSEPKLYCKPLLTKRTRVNTAEIITTRQYTTNQLGELDSKIENVVKGKVEGWHAGNLPEEEFNWLQ